MSDAAFHKAEMMRHFEAGRLASARFHCRIWTRLTAAGKQSFLNDGASGPGWLADIRPAGMPSPHSGELKGE